MRRHRRQLVLCMAAVVVQGLTLAMAMPPAVAHDRLMTYWQFFPQRNRRQCVMAESRQNHGGNILSRKVRTTALQANCGDAHWFVEGGRIAHRGWVYKAQWYGAPGDICIQGGWQFAAPNSYYLEWETNQNLFPACNYDAINVVITHDIESALWDPVLQVANHNQWVPLPTTWHCYPDQSGC